MLGLDNTGVYRFNYYSEDTDPSVFNGEEILWTFVRDALSAELIEYYTALENGKLKADAILPYFNENQSQIVNEAFSNADAKYKYINPARNGYKDDLNGKDIAPGAGPYLYAAQGDRALMREWFVNNRMKFTSGKYRSEKFQMGDRIEYRQYFPSSTTSDFKDHLGSLIAVEPSGDFTLTSVKTGYAGAKIGANNTSVIERFDGIETKTITMSADQANGTEAYILGLSNLSDLGDLSNKYMQKFIIASDEVRLKNLTLGNPHKDYYNPYWNTVAEGQSPTVNVSRAIYLEKFNM
jgi:hypothetical protein